MNIASRFALGSGMLVLSLLISCAAPPSSPLSPGLDRTGWAYSPAQAEELPADAGDRQFTPLSPEELSLMDPILGSSGSGYLWLRRDFQWTPPENPAGKESARIYSLLLGRISMTDRTYLNGELIGSSGQHPPRWFSDWNRFRSYSVPAELLQPGRNTLMIKIYGRGEAFQQGPIRLTEQNEAAPYARQADFFASQINAIVAVLVFVFGLYHFLLFAKRRQDRENLYYGIVSVGLAFYSTNFFITRIPGISEWGLSYLIFQKFIFTAEFIIAFGLRRFFREFLKQPDGKILRRADSILFGAALLLIWAAPGYQVFQTLANLAQGYVLFVAVYAVAAVFRSMRHGRPEARILLIGLIPFLFAIIFDLLAHQLLELENAIYLGSLGFPFFLVAVLFILANRFVQYHNEVEDLNVHLEQKVEDRTRELRETNQNLASALAELEEAQATAERDMQMAVTVQQGLYQTAPPPSEKWEVSHYFQPMSGVSGDLYDYYAENGRLAGIGLFDVSGHGIASGLITMIAKSVSERNFRLGRGKKLGQVLQGINREMIHEIGSVENYVTGVLLRLTENRVEYVNAGHTDMIYKNGRTGNTMAVTGKDRDIKGLFLGIEGMESEYGTLSMETQVDDTLLLYTDCLTECVPAGEGRQKEEFGTERLLQALKEAPSANTDEIRDHLVEKLKEWRGSRFFNDDFTLVVLRRKRQA